MHVFRKRKEKIICHMQGKHSQESSYEDIGLELSNWVHSNSYKHDKIGQAN